MGRTPQIKNINDIAQLFGVQANEDETITLAQIAAQLEKVPYIPYPVALHTVDVIATRNNRTEILMGKKPFNEKWVFIGGFVEPTHSAEHTAVKEFFEEASAWIEDESRFQYLGSAFINDSRYLDSCHKITSSLFTIELTEDEMPLLKGGDDIECVQWFRIDEIEPIIKQLHGEIFQRFKSKLLPNTGFKIGDICEFMMDIETYRGEIKAIEGDKANVLTYIGLIHGIPLNELSK